MSVVRVTLPTSKLWDPIVSLERVELGNSNLVYKLITMNTSVGMTDYPQRGYADGHVTFFIFLEIIDNIYTYYISSSSRRNLPSLTAYY